MKKGKNPTRRQKEYFMKLGLEPENWLIVKTYVDTMLIRNKKDNSTKTVENIN